MTIDRITKERGIQEILHFTTNVALSGIFGKKAVLSRKRLPEDKYLEHTYSPNCAVRKDIAWLDYVNLSITRINSSLFDISRGPWHGHEDKWWCVLSFDAIILTHPGVYFSTTNNMWSGAKRKPGKEGLEALFVDQVVQYVDYSGNPTRVASRDPSQGANQPTCYAAEVLYPGQLSIDHLKRVYTATEHHADIVHAQMSTFNITSIEITADPGVFGNDT